MGALPPIEMANIGMADTIILMILALVVFGPRRLPQIGRQIGKLMYEFRKASNDFKFQMEEELRQAEEADRRKKEAERQQALAAAQASAPVAQSAETAGSSSVTSASSVTPSALPLAGASAGESNLPGAAVETAQLRIQPPSTGEIVATNRPGAVSHAPQSAAEAATSQTAASQPAANDNASGTNDAERSEPAAHHG